MDKKPTVTLTFRMVCDQISHSVNLGYTAELQPLGEERTIKPTWDQRITLGQLSPIHTFRPGQLYQVTVTFEPTD